MIRIQEEDFDLGREIAALTAGDRDIGGIVSFVGLVRDMSPDSGGGHRGVSAMTLEHYPGMTEKQLTEIETEACRRWPLAGCLVIHRHGRLAPGDRIVLVACAAAHRGDAFEACQFIIDWLKTKAPFWKQEDTPAGPQWVEARTTDDAAAARWTAGKK